MFTRIKSNMLFPEAFMGQKKKKTTCPLKLLFISKRWICHMHPLGQRPSQISKVKE